MDKTSAEGGETAASRGGPSFASISAQEQLIELLYQAAAGHQSLDRAAKMLASATRSHHALRISSDAKLRTSRLLVGQNPQPGIFSDYARVPYDQNLWANFPGHSRISPVCRSSMAISRADLLKRPQFAHFLERYDIGFTLHIMVMQTADRVVQFVITRPRGAEDYDRADFELATRVAVHAANAHTLQREVVRSRLAELTLSGLAESSGIGVAILEPPNLVFTSHAGRSMLLSLGARIGKVPSGVGFAGQGIAREQVQLPRSITEAIARINSQEGTTLLFTEPQGERRFAVQARFLDRGAGAGAEHEPPLALLIYDPDQALPADDQLLRVVYELTSAEARVSSLLAEGRSVEDISEHLDVSPHTVRAHLKRTFEKTGATRQAELVKLVLSSARLPRLKNVVAFPLPRAPEKGASGRVRMREARSSSALAPASPARSNAPDEESSPSPADGEPPRPRQILGV